MVEMGLLLRDYCGHGGWEVSVWELAAPGDAAPDAVACRGAWLEAGGEISAWDEIEPLGAPDLLVDAVFGTGLTRPIPVELANMFRLFRDDWEKAARKERAQDASRECGYSQRSVL